MTVANTWTQQQQLAIDLRGHRILVSAAAGSGKTAVLTERIAKRLCDMDDPVDADQLLVMTFTRAAAAEMKERIRRRLGQMQREPGLSPAQTKRLREQEAMLDSAYVTTIDSFCSRVVRDHPDEAGVDPSFRVLDKIEKKLICQDVMEEMLEEYYGKADPDFLNFVEAYTKVKSSDSLDEMIMRVYEAAQNAVDPEAWYAAQTEDDIQGYSAYMMDQAALLLEAACEQAQRALGICLEEDGPVKSESAIREDIDRIKAARGAGDIDELRNRLSLIEFPSLSRASKGVDPEKKERLAEVRGGYKDMLKNSLIKALCDELADDYRDMDDKARVSTGVLVSLARDFDGRYKAKKREKNVMEFSDIAHMTLKLLNMENIRQEYCERFREIYIDEYQDSSDIQEELKNAIDTGEVFMVGDVKQAIYGFRNARPELFMEKYDSFAGAENTESPDIRIDLSTNFRSRATVLDGINRIFRKIMMRELGGVQYTREAELNPGAAFPEPSEGQRIGGRNQLLIALEDAGDDQDGSDARYRSEDESADKPLLEARMIAGKIKSLMDESEGMSVQDKDGYRRLRYSDIVILLRDGKNAQTYQRVLMDSGIPAYLDSKKGYFDTPEIRTMLAALGAVNNPLRDVELTAWLCSPMIGMTQEEIARLMAVYKRRRRKDTLRCVKRALELAGELLPDEGAADESGEEAGERREVQQDALMTESIRTKAALALARLADYDERSRSMPISELISYICADTGYYDYVSALPGGNVRRANLDRLMDIARNYSGTGYQGLFNFVRYAQAVQTYDEDMGEANILGEHDDIVRIMTIHKSKGMEFPVCILAEAGRLLKPKRCENVMIDHELGIGCAYIDLDKHVRYRTLKQLVVHHKLKTQQLGEELRVLYVALTRAKEQLIITGTCRDDEKELRKRRNTEGLTGVRSASRYLDWLLMDPKGFDLDVQTYMPSELSDDMQQTAGKQTAEDWLDRLHITPETAAGYDSVFNFVYPYQADTVLHNKISISELKRLGQHEDEERTYVPEYTASHEGRTEPGTGGTVGAHRGTVYHKVFERLDFSKVHDAASAEEYLDELLSDHAERWAVSSRDVLTWIGSDIGKQAARADAEGRFYREREFIMGLSASELGIADSQEPVLVQGIIDAYIEDEDTITLIDYKTDRVTRAEQLRERYFIQLKYYAIALEKMKHKPVRHRIIWSVALGEAVEL